MDDGVDCGRGGREMVDGRVGIGDIGNSRSGSRVVDGSIVEWMVV